MPVERLGPERHADAALGTTANLSPKSRAIFQMGLASRHRRSAFPGEFERRLTSKESKLHEQIAKAVKPHAELIADVFFDVDEGAEVGLRLGREAADAAAKAIRKAFKDRLSDPTKTWQHIELRSCDPVSESAMTYQQFKPLKRWRLEHISLAAEPQQPVLAEWEPQEPCALRSLEGLREVPAGSRLDSRSAQRAA